MIHTQLRKTASFPQPPATREAASESTTTDRNVDTVNLGRQKDFGSELIGLTGYTLFSAVPFLGAVIMGEVAGQEPEQANVMRTGGALNIAGTLALIAGVGAVGTGALGVGAALSLYGKLRAEHADRQ